MNRNQNLNKKILFLLCSLFVVNLHAQTGLSFRFGAAVEAPVSLSQFDPGIGGSLFLDWAYLPFKNNFAFGISAGGGYINLPLEGNAGNPISLLEGKAGLFLRWRPFDRWTFQGNVYQGAYRYSWEEFSDTSILYNAALNAQFHISPHFSLYADGGYTYRFFVPLQPLTSINAAIGVKLNMKEILSGATRVQIERAEQFRVFPVSWAWYENNPVAMLKITNDEPNTITDISLSFFMDSYMSQPWNFANIPSLAPNESVDIPITALFNEAMLNLVENVNANGTLQMQYRSLGAWKGTASVIQMPIFHRSALSWDDDRRAAAFVSPRDSAARFFARYVASSVEARGLLPNIPPNVQYAVALFEALRLYGISYVVVPTTSFKLVASDESVLDSVSYPYQALYYRGGDCSYLSILFCSLLEVLNIESAFITIPGHIYIAFEIGDNTWRSGSADIIEIETDGVRKRWLPVEITIPAEGFNRAWRVGARQWRNSGEDADLFPIRDCWSVYPPVTVPASGNHLPEMPARADIIRAMERELR